jgi:hypothetical protein
MAEKTAKGLLWTDDGRAYKTNPRTGKKVYYRDLDKDPNTGTNDDTSTDRDPKVIPDKGKIYYDDKGVPYKQDVNGKPIYAGGEQAKDPTKGTTPGDGGGGTDDGTTEPSIMDMDTDVDIADNPLFNPDFGPDGPSTVTDEGDGTGTTVINPDGSVKLGDVSAHSREVQDEELVANQMNSLLASDSKFIQDARRQGLEQANALGGLGGTVGIGAAQQSAMRAALPIAEADAQAYRTAATENLEALNRFSQLNHQRATQLEMSNISAATSLATTKISASVQWASQQLTSATQRDISRLDNETRLRATEMGGAIQERMAGVQYKFNKMLNEMQNNFGLQNTALQGEYMIKANEIQHQMQRETNYINMATGVYDSFMNQLTQLNGMEMDNNARQAAINTITTGAQNLYKLINSLFPDMTPIEFG